MRYFAVGNAGVDRFVLAEFALRGEAATFTGDVGGELMSEAELAGSTVLEDWRRGDSRRVLQAAIAESLADRAREYRYEPIGIDEAEAHPDLEDSADVPGLRDLRAFIGAVHEAREIVKPYEREEQRAPQS